MQQSPSRAFDRRSESSRVVCYLVSEQHLISLFKGNEKTKTKERSNNRKHHSPLNEHWVEIIFT